MGQFSGKASAATYFGAAHRMRALRRSKTKKAARVSPPPCRCSSLSVFRDTHVKIQCPESSRKFNKGSSSTEVMAT